MLFYHLVDYVTGNLMMIATIEICCSVVMQVPNYGATVVQQL
jgi:hypothetical protein